MGVSLMRILPVVKAYPVVDQVSFSEAVCVAGIDMDEPHRWVRLFPLDFRGLEHVQRFRKYETITLEANRSSKDSRPESYAPVLGSIEVGEHIGTDGGTWQRRMSFFDAIEDESMCEIQRRQKTDRQSLGVFRPESVGDLVVSPAPQEFESNQRAIIEQGSLFGDRAGDKQRTTLEPLPVKAKFKYRCSDGSCEGHEQSFVDWELGALYRRLRDDEGYDQDACLTAVRERFLHYCRRDPGCPLYRWVDASPPRVVFDPRACLSQAHTSPAAGVALLKSTAGYGRSSALPARRRPATSRRRLPCSSWL